MTHHVDRLYARSWLNRPRIALAAVLAAAGLAAAPFPAAFAEPVTVAPVQLPTFADLIEQVSPAVVSVRVRTGGSQVAAAGTNNGIGPIPPQGSRGGTSLGSGFFISGDGYVVTNNHVVDNATTYTVITSDGTEYNAKLIGRDEKTDLALLKVDNAPPFPYVKFSEEVPRIGDWVVAVGNPFGLGGTVTFGIVSARGRSLTNGPYDDYIQIDAPINRGNSGGPTFNNKGEVIGVNTAIYSTSGGSVGIAFDIPAGLASSITSTLKEKGAIIRGWLGVQTQSVTAGIAESVKLAGASGAMVSEPQSGSPAANAGIRAGDVILAIDGKSIKDPRDLALTIGSTTPNTTVKVLVWRDGRQQEIMVTLGTVPVDTAPVPGPIRPPPRGDGNGGGGQPGTLGRADPPAPLRDGTSVPELGLTLGAPKAGANGVDIVNVNPVGPGYDAGLEDGDTLLAVGGQAVTSPAEVLAAIDAARKAGAKNVLLRIQSGPNFAFLTIPLG